MPATPNARHWKVSVDYLRQTVAEQGGEPVSRSQAAMIRNAIADTLFISDEMLSLKIAIYAVDTPKEEEEFRRQYQEAVDG